MRLHKFSFLMPGDFDAVETTKLNLFTPCNRQTIWLAKAYRGHTTNIIREVLLNPPPTVLDSVQHNRKLTNGTLS
ncbi:MAG: hypothetical protein CMM47_08200 [Rhodospirillaceae bacterium]|nr:hypothetical protein [Rhodospirillaceae bacterium]